MDESPIPERYSRQVRFAGIGADGQRALLKSRVGICGCGALGTVLADMLVRAGVGFVRIIDRDFVEPSNLQRQVLFDEADVAAQMPKAMAAAQKLARINSTVTVEPIVADISAANVLGLLTDVDLILDGTDNFETRYLINDAALTLGTPWIYAGVVGSHGQTMTIIPGETACLRCVLEAPPPAGTTATCDTAGVLAPAIHVMTSLQTVAAFKFLTGQRSLIEHQLTMVDVWDGTWRTIGLDDLREHSDCPACGRGERQWLKGHETSQSTILCGRNAVQVTPATPTPVDLAKLAADWNGLGAVTSNPFLIRLTTPTLQVTAFKDGRAIIQGTDDPAVARSAYARYLGG